jgi:hypothetical protein
MTLREHGVAIVDRCANFAARREGTANVVKLILLRHETLRRCANAFLSQVLALLQNGMRLLHLDEREVGRKVLPPALDIPRPINADRLIAILKILQRRKNA